MRIDPKIEEPTRTMLGYAIRGEFEEVGNFAVRISDEILRECLQLCVIVAGYTVIDVCENRWPSDAFVHKLAQGMAGDGTPLDLKEADIYNYLARTALGGEPLDEVFPSAEEAAALPILITAAIIVAYGIRGRKWWEYLETVESAVEQAAAVSSDVVPAILLQWPPHKYRGDKATRE